MRLALTAGATAAKVCGAGGGGCLFCYGPPRARAAIAEALASGGARLLDYRIDTEGLEFSVCMADVEIQAHSRRIEVLHQFQELIRGFD